MGHAGWSLAERLISAGDDNHKDEIDFDVDAASSDRQRVSIYIDENDGDTGDVERIDDEADSNVEDNNSESVDGQGRRLSCIHSRQLKIRTEVS